jgi:hypothetical protein
MIAKGIVLRVVVSGGWFPCCAGTSARWSEIENGGQSQEVFESDPHFLSEVQVQAVETEPALG